MIDIQVQKKLDSPSGNMVLDVGFTIEEGQMVALFGESGAGKTSLLRILSGLLQPDKGRISVHERIWFQSQPKVINLKPQERNVGFVFQDYALFPHMTVLENLQFAAGTRKNVNLQHLLELNELGDLKHKKPKNLSGGQQQRVALARALAQQPNILLLDEPLSALDDNIRRKLQRHLLEAHKEYKLTTILVSHNIEEIIKLSDWVIELHHGKTVEQGHPHQLFASKEISEDFKVTAEVLSIESSGNSFVAQLLVQNHVLKMSFSQKQGKSIQKGDRIVLASNDFKPNVYKE
ncbi:sulfate/molybdate ABC transporter ATP-binding protein [Flagellimonas meridianipacifica]|uniref:Molybdate transport system ATP-binding protein n=1 Tax=Flagellimonas meridianipacifica TaxID=1080225 RepID=A0A2T0MGJ7_9FLAO|nr:ATP-binding cassette domain-containing protein [Allomuricauda pacifica]PRX56707.1 molybdate transport system ATP-binding protein [Allomuricauda pacifica]